MSSPKPVCRTLHVLAWTLVAAVTVFGGPQGDAPVPGVSGTIDGKSFVWEVPDPSSESCSVFGSTFRVSFSAKDGSSAIEKGSSVVRITLPHGDAYHAVRNPLKASAFREAISIEGDTVTYSGTLQFGPVKRTQSSKVVEVDATITARCK
jgi:hypothetical protein